MNAKERIAKLLEERISSKKNRKLAQPPRYDSVFYEGVAWLDSLGGISMKDLQAPPPNPVRWRIKIRGSKEQVVGPCRTAFEALGLYRNDDGTTPAFAELDYAEQIEE